MTEPRVPTTATLRKYGLTVDEWRAMLERQGNACAICQRVPDSGVLHIDHQHVRNWKRLPPEQRKTYVRGVLCWPCNATLKVRITVAWLRGAVKYLTAYEKRLTSQTKR